jgi:flagellar biosynthesis protein FlhA
MPEAEADIERTYTGGEISKEAFVVQKGHLQRQINFLGAMGEVRKFITGNIKVTIFIMAIGIFGSIVIGTTLHGQTIQETMETSVMLGISGSIIIFLPLLLLSAAADIVSNRVYVSSLQQTTDIKGVEKI